MSQRSAIVKTPVAGVVVSLCEDGPVVLQADTILVEIEQDKGIINIDASGLQPFHGRGIVVERLVQPGADVVRRQSILRLTCDE